MNWICFVFGWIIAGSLVEANNDDDIITLPPELAQKPNEPDSVTLKRNILQSLINKCKPIDSAKTSLEQSINNAEVCITSLTDENVFKSEIEAAKRERNDIKVYKTYCKILPQLTQCVYNMMNTSTLKECFTDKERISINAFYNTTNSLGDFICQNDIEKISNYIAVHGQECLQSKQTAVRKCYGNPLDVSTPDKVQELLSYILAFERTQCDELVNKRKCVVSELAKCDSSITPNTTENVFNLCSSVNFPQYNTEKLAFKNNSAGSPMTSATLLTALAALAIFKLQ